MKLEATCTLPADVTLQVQVLLTRLLSLLTAAQIKPDGVQRGLVGEIIGRLERKGFTLRALRLRTVPRQLAEEHYMDLRERPFFPDLVDYITSGPVVAMVRACR